jgi:hypothetical protein
MNEANAHTAGYIQNHAHMVDYGPLMMRSICLYFVHMAGHKKYRALRGSAAKRSRAASRYGPPSRIRRGVTLAEQDGSHQPTDGKTANVEGLTPP